MFKNFLCDSGKFQNIKKKCLDKWSVLMMCICKDLKKNMGEEEEKKLINICGILTNTFLQVKFVKIQI